MSKIVALIGNLARPSRTVLVAETALALAAERLGAHIRLIDLPAFGPTLGAARNAGELDAAGAALLDEITGADALVAATPIYKGSYTGLFKHVIDLIEPAALLGKPVLLMTTGGGERHALAVEHHLRPLFGFFEAQTLATAVHFADRDFSDGALRSGPTLLRLERAVSQFAPFLPAPVPQHRVPDIQRAAG